MPDVGGETRVRGFSHGGGSLMNGLVASGERVSSYVSPHENWSFKRA